MLPLLFLLAGWPAAATGVPSTEGLLAHLRELMSTQVTSVSMRSQTLSHAAVYAITARWPPCVDPPASRSRGYGQVRFEINLTAASRAGLTSSPQLLELGRAVPGAARRGRIAGAYVH